MFNKAEEILHTITDNYSLQYSFPEGFIEDMTIRARQHSFLNDPALKNQHLDLMRHLLCRKVKPLADVKSDFNKHLAVLLHMIPSQPARGTEFADIRIRNSDLSFFRPVYT
ncbi:hypothetical protein K474DRAFT_1713784 [Panus rudis PR-1116 ss-1]|nr:hypothetical protein K474DRAFT_1713784 [Panus rudis PR-1116 ss-1]